MSTEPTVAKTVWTRPPVHSPGYFLSVQERGGYSFDQQGYVR